MHRGIHFIYPRCILYFNINNLHNKQIKKMSFLFDNSRTISIDLYKLMRDIPTEMLEDELEERKALQASNPKEAEKKEKYRSDTVDCQLPTTKGSGLAITT